MESSPNPPNSEEKQLVVRQPLEVATVCSAAWPERRHGQQWAQEPAGGFWSDWRRVLERYWWLLAAGAVLGTACGFFVTTLQAPVYQARVSLEIQDLNQNFLNLRQLAPVLDSGPSLTPSDIQTQIKIIQSSTLIERTLKRLDALKSGAAGFGKSRLETWRAALNLPRPAPDTAQRIVERARENLEIREDRQARIVEVWFDSPDAKFASDFVNTLAAEFIDQNVEARWKMSQQTGEWLSRQLRETRDRLQESEDALLNYAHRSGLVFTSEKENLSEQKLRQLQEALSKARADRVQKQSRFETAGSASPETLPEVLDDTALRDYQAKLTDLRRQRAELAMNFTPAFPKLKQTDAQIATLESALEKSRTAIIKRIRTEYEDARRREELMAKDFSEQNRLVSAEAQKVVQYNILKQEVDTHRQLYEAMLQRVKEAGIASAMKASNVRVVDSAKPPERPYKPNVPLQTTVGLLAGLSLGAAVLVGHERRDRTLREPGDASFHLALPELGAVPSSGNSDAGHRKSNGHNGSRVSPLPIIEIASPGSAGSAGNGKVQPERIELAAWQQQLSRVAVAFRAVRTSILFSGQNGRHPRVLVVTSPSAAEGKTTVATNLAVTLAGSQRRVLLIDGDLRRSRLHDLFGLSSDYGLADLLDDGPATCLTGLEYVIQRTAVPGLYVLASGPAPANATDLLDSRCMSELVKQTRKAFDMIVIDTPPVLELPDARILGRVADAVILVVRAGKTTRDAGLAAKRQLQADGSLVLGSILNDWDADGHGSDYRYYAYREG